MERANRGEVARRAIELVMGGCVINLYIYLLWCTWSGYLVEHELYGGVVVTLDGTLQDDEPPCSEIEATYAKVSKMSHFQGYDKVVCKLWDSEKAVFGEEKNYRFSGRRITRHDDDK